MLLTVMVLLSVAAFVCAMLSQTNPPRAPLWVAVVLLCVVELIRTLPLGK